MFEKSWDWKWWWSNQYGHQAKYDMLYYQLGCLYQ